MQHENRDEEYIFNKDGNTKAMVKVMNDEDPDYEDLHNPSI